MKKKKLFQKVMGLTVTVALAGSTCISPALAEELFLDGTEVQELSVPEVNAQSADGEEDLFTDGTGENLFTAVPEETPQVLTVQDAIRITTQPKNIVTEKGETVEFSVKAEGEGLTYQWQYRTSKTGSWKNFASATAATIRKVTGDWDGWEVKCVIKDSAGNSLDSDIATISFGNGQVQPISITTQPKDVVTKKGETVEFSVKAAGNGLKYQWQYRTGKTGSWKNFASATASTIRKVTGDWDGWQVKCVIKDADGNSLDSNIVAISFGGEQSPITITEQPKDIVTEKGATVEWSVAATGKDLKYQWQYRTSESGAWKNFGSATTATIRKVTGDWDGWQVKCVIKDGEGNSVETKVVKITFGNSSQEKLAITEQPEDVVTAKGEKVQWKIAATGKNITYQWQYRTSATGSWKNFASAKTASIEKVVGDWDGWQVRCVVTDEEKNSVTSKVVNVTFKKQGPSIVEQPKDVVSRKGETVKFSIKATGTGLTYQWQYRTSATGSWKNFASAKTASIEKVAGDWDGSQVKCVVKDSAGNSLDSDIVKITLNKKETLAITEQPRDVETEKGATVKFSVKATGSGLTYQWQYRTSATGSWKNFASATEATIQKVTGNWDGWQVRCVIKDDENNSVTTRTATITFTAKKLEITAQPADVKVQLGKTADFTVKVNKDKVSYQWETRGAYQSKFTAVKNATESTLHVEANERNNGQVYRCVITDADGTAVTSNEAALRIQYQNHTATFVNAETKEVIVTAEAEAFEAKAGLPAGTIVHLPKAVTEKTSKPYSYYTMENETQIPVNLEAVVEGSSASYDTLELFFYVNSDVVVYVNA